MPAALAGLLELGPRPPARAPARVPAAPLAALLAGPVGRRPAGAQVDSWLREPLASLIAHWRVDSRWSGEQAPASRSLEAIDCAEGMWLVTPEEGDVLLEPVATLGFWCRLAALFPRGQPSAVHQERQGAVVDE